MHSRLPSPARLHHATRTHTHTAYSHNTQLPHTQLTHTQLAQTQLVHTQLTHTQLTHTHNWRHRPSLCVAGMALGDIDRHFAWQAWHLATSTCIRRGRRDNYAWQAWHLATSTVTLPGRRGTWRHRRAFYMAGMALMALSWLWWQAWHLSHFAWQAWALETWACALRGSALCHLPLVRHGCLRGRRGTWRHGLSFCVAGVALEDMCVAAVCATYATGLPLACLVPVRRSCLRGRRGTLRHRPSLCVAGVTLCDIDRHFAWQAWHLETWPCTLRGRRGTYGTGLALVAHLVPSWRRGRRACRSTLYSLTNGNGFGH